MTDSRIEFLGAGPFLIGAAQSAAASAVGDTVELRLYAIVGHDPHPRPIAFQLTHRVANALGHDLVAAALRAESGPT